jgi:hypothetical protein
MSGLCSMRTRASIVTYLPHPIQDSAITSPYRLTVFAGVLQLARHVLARHELPFDQHVAQCSPGANPLACTYAQSP